MKSNLNTKLNLVLNSIKKELQEKIIYFELFFEYEIFFLFLGFLSGNLFGSFLSIFRKLNIWDGYIILAVVISVEIISYLIYHSKNRTSFCAFRFNIPLGPSLRKPAFVTNPKYVRADFPSKATGGSSLLNSSVEKNFFKYKNFKFFKNYIKTSKNFFFIFFDNLSFYFNKISQFSLLHKQKFFKKSLNLFKIGILLGFFIDAFKVGS